MVKVWLSATEYGTTEFTGNGKWELELGDALFSLICLATTTGVDIGSALSRAIEKYEKRIAATGSPASAGDAGGES